MPDRAEKMTNETAATQSITDETPGAGALRYVLVTPARNEVENIERTIRSVVNQTVLPLKWVIISDGSTDGTDEVVQKYASKFRWIELIRKPERAERHFAGKADCFNAGYRSLKNLPFEIVGNLDADLSFEEGYFSFLLSKFAKDPALGLAGTPFREGKEIYDYRFTSTDHVSGACQLFRRGCFEEIGGYLPIKAGGVDLVAGITARMKGWTTRTFTEKVCEHHRKTQAGKHSSLAAGFRSGYHDYLMGTHPLWQLLRCIYQSSKPPFVIGGSLLLAGYFWALCRRAERPISKELVHFRKREQMRRLRILFGILFQHLGAPQV
jgi:poly-beta-1,6-N-acetyl-D-glucosamine synthase